jgi:hypothetical protein
MRIKRRDDSDGERAMRSDYFAEIDEVMSQSRGRPSMGAGGRGLIGASATGVVGAAT